MFCHQSANVLEMFYPDLVRPSCRMRLQSLLHILLTYTCSPLQSSSYFIFLLAAAANNRYLGSVQHAAPRRWSRAPLTAHGFTLSRGLFVSPPISKYFLKYYILIKFGLVTCVVSRYRIPGIYSGTAVGRYLAHCCVQTRRHKIDHFEKINVPRLYILNQLSDVVVVNAGEKVSAHRARLNTLVLLTLVSSKEVSDMYPSRRYALSVTRATEISHAAC